MNKILKALIKQLSIICGVTLLFSSNLCAQTNVITTKQFVRVFDLQGKKLSSGKILSISDTSIQLRYMDYVLGDFVKFTIEMRNIGSIKTKHSAGYNVIVGATSVAVSGAIAGAILCRNGGLVSPTGGECALWFAIFGVPVGALIGSINSLARRQVSFEINGNMEKWKVFKVDVINGLSMR